MATTTRRTAAPVKKAAPRKAAAKPKAKQTKFATPEEALAAAQADIAKLTTLLDAKAKDQGLCDQYYTVLENANKELTTLTVPVKPKVLVTSVGIRIGLDEKLFPGKNNFYNERYLTHAQQKALTDAIAKALTDAKIPGVNTIDTVNAGNRASLQRL